ncbi:MAG: hypothetical protein M3R30_00615 [Candidatus Eremiobacteraeota bacterium]|nr:hypothetical protein [Candidatus Eremiobacteraeota bacterium]
MGRTYGDAESAADLATYYGHKRTVAFRTVLIATPFALVSALWLPRPALALGIGALCGIANMLLGTYGNERLVDVRNVGVFVLSSFLRLGLFGIVAASLAVWGPWWSFGPYFAGFFLPLALYALGVPRAFDASKRK